MTSTSVAPAETESEHTEFAILVVLLLLRVATLLLGVVNSVAKSNAGHRGTSLALATGLAAASGLALGSAYRAVRNPTTARRLLASVVVVETVSSGVGLIVLSNLVPAADRTGPRFWMEQYAVISCLIFAAMSRRLWAGALCTAVIASTYFAVVGWPVHLKTPDQRGQAADALSNSVSYLAFWGVGYVGFRLYRHIAGQVSVLRQAGARMAAEGARISESTRAYRIGHDIPKAFLRELRAGRLQADELRRWAPRFRADLIDALSRDPRAPVDLPAELQAVSTTFSASVPLTLDMSGLTGPYDGLPALTLVEAVRECLNNASYHCGAVPVAVTATRDEDAVRLVVRDEGRGCDADVVRRIWASKSNAVHQVEVAGGSYFVESGPGRGTTVTLVYPHAAAAAVEGLFGP